MICSRFLVFSKTVWCNLLKHKFERSYAYSVIQINFGHILSPRKGFARNVDFEKFLAKMLLHKITRSLHLSLTLLCFQIVRILYWKKRLLVALQIRHVYATFKRRGNNRFHVVSTWNTRGVFVGYFLIMRCHQKKVFEMSRLSFFLQYSEGYSKPSPTSKIQLFAIINNGLQLQTIFATSTLNVWLGFWIHL